MSGLPGVSIVIANHNYGRYLAEAIDSALAQTHRLVEVIVVDDGSTDGSAAVIEAYGDRVTAVFQARAGQTQACAAGFSRSRHPLVLFLDADDRLVPEAAAMAARLLAAAASPARVSKLQFRLQSMTARGRLLAHLYPKYPADATPAALRAELLRTGHYACPPTSGNVYTRDFLLAVSPFAEHPHVDAVLNTLAPLYGEVITSPEVLGHYRVHPASNSYAGSGAVERLRALIALDPLRIAILERHCRRRGLAFAGREALAALLPYRELELVIAKLEPAGPGHRRRLLALLGATLRAGRAAPYTRRNRLLRAFWITAVALAPRPLARWLTRLRYDPTSRGRLVARLVEGSAHPARGLSRPEPAARPPHRRATPRPGQGAPSSEESPA